MPANGNAKRRTTPTNLDAAIVAYSLTREGIREIEDRLNVCDMTLYRELKRRGIKARRRPRRQEGDRICMLDGCNAILKRDQTKYCCVEHVNKAYRQFCRQKRERATQRKELS